MSVCEFCWTNKNVSKFYECACDEHSDYVFICGRCKEKYFNFIKKNPPVLLPTSITFRGHISLVLGDIGVSKMEKETTTMKVSYNGFTGELVKLERKGSEIVGPCTEADIYDLSIHDSEKKVTYSFTGVKLEDMKFLGGVVSFGG